MISQRYIRLIINDVQKSTAKICEIDKFSTRRRDKIRLSANVCDRVICSLIKHITVTFR